MRKPRGVKKAMLQAEKRTIGGMEVEVYTVGTLIIGTGAAGLNCAEHLADLYRGDVAIVTDRLGAGTSNNSGSDKQTYYKIGIFGDVPDSPLSFAHSLFDGGMMHGDIAYVEALGSATEFFHLIKNGVPFPYNRYGAYVGYKTDHDPRQRGTSCGPKTSILMVEKSLAQVRRNGTPIFDRHEVIRLLTAGEGDRAGAERVIGAVCIDRRRVDAENHGLVLFNCENIVMATGGPGEMYAISVYPRGQVGNHGLALEIGAKANNLTESQFGLASIGFRWNLSGTYQQVIPNYFSTDAQGNDRRNFLADYFDDMARMATCIFLKGYQWPFNAKRLAGRGSSLVDIAVNNEIMAGRRVFMDFLSNPVPEHGMADFDIAHLEPEARTYLERSGALQDTPYDRLLHMNPPSIEIYAEHGVDLREPLEVAVCAQHNNGGLVGNLWWESNIKHLFPIGEINGSHGIRPGGSALNSGQVGGLRAAQYIANVYTAAPRPLDQFIRLAEPQVKEELETIRRLLNAPADAQPCDSVRAEIQDRMSRHAAFIREGEAVARALNEGRALLADVRAKGMRLQKKADLCTAFQNDHLCLTHIAFLEALKAYIERGGGSRGSFMILDEKGDQEVESRRGRELRHRSENEAMRREILEVQQTRPGEFRVEPVEVRPLPQDDSWFETAWAEWRDGRIFH